MTYLNISKIKASKLKEIGFKSKAIAKTFAKLSNIKAKKYETEEDFLNALKNKLSNFQKIGLDFTLLKYIDTSSEKVKQNREKKKENKRIETEKKSKEIIEKIDTGIKQDRSISINIVNDEKVKNGQFCL